MWAHADRQGHEGAHQSALWGMTLHTYADWRGLMCCSLVHAPEQAILLRITVRLANVFQEAHWEVRSRAGLGCRSACCVSLPCMTEHLSIWRMCRPGIYGFCVWAELGQENLANIP